MIVSGVTIFMGPRIEISGDVSLLR